MRIVRTAFRSDHPVITKDFHSAKDFRQIRGKSFVIMVGVAVPDGLFGHTRRVLVRWHARLA
jgi:hypothetical protein